MLRRVVLRRCAAAGSATLGGKAPEAIPLRFEHPATGVPGSMDPSLGKERASYVLGYTGPLWREHWDGNTQRPYYHNIKTHEVQWAKPEGVESLYPDYYAKNPEGGTATLGTTATSSSSSGPAWFAAVTKYGPGGLALYLVIHFSSLACVFALLLLGVDFSAVAVWLNITMPSGGSYVALWAIAIALNKVFVPVQIMLTGLMAPRFAPLLAGAIKKFRGTKGL